MLGSNQLCGGYFRWCQGLDEALGPQMCDSLTLWVGETYLQGRIGLRPQKHDFYILEHY